MRGFVRQCVTRPVAVTIVAFAVGVLGLVSLQRLAIDLLPSVDVPWISIVTAYEGVGPQEIETLITRPIEGATSKVQGVDRIEAVSAEGLSRVQLQFSWGTDLQHALDDVRSAVDGVRTWLPEDAEPPSVYKFDLASVPILSLGVTGTEEGRQLKFIAEDTLARALERQAGVASVDVRGGRDREIRVELEPTRLMAFGISATQVSEALARENRTVSAGDMQSSELSVLIRTAGEFATLADVERTVVATREQRPITVADLGKVSDTIRRVRSELWINGEPGIEIRVFKQSGANTVEVSRAVRAEVERLNLRFGERVRLQVLSDAADYIEAAVEGVRNSAWFGAGLAALVLLVFLRSLRATLIIATTIPLSVLATFSLVLSQGMTLNLISFGGLALGIGMLVDAAVVILESIYRKRERGMSAAEAAIAGTNEVATAVVAGTLTTIAVFVPVVFVGGLAGVLFGEMALVVTFSLVCALAVAMSLVPMLAAKLLSRPLGGGGGRTTGIHRRLESRLSGLEAAYGRTIRAALQAPWAIVTLALVLLGASTALLPQIGVELMPSSDEARLEADIELPVGTPLETTSEIMRSAERKSLETLTPEERLFWITSAGPENWWRPSGSSEGEVDVILVPRGQRERDVEVLVAHIQRALDDLPGAGVRVKASSSNVLSRIVRRGDGRLSVDIVGHDLDTADALAARVGEVAKGISGITYVRPDRELGQLERVLVVDRARAAELGLGSSEVAATIEQYVLGRVATQYRDQGDEFDLRVQLSEHARQRVEQLAQLPIIAADGRSVPLHALSDVIERKGPSSISRVNQQRLLRVDLGSSGRTLDRIAADLEQGLAGLEVPDGFDVRLGGELAQQHDTFSELLVGILLSLFLVYAVMAVQFESFRHPLVIMASVPFAFVGVCAALMATGTTFNMNSFLGAIVLVGIVVNNAIVLVDTANLLRREGLELREALVAAGQRRLRPILMTTLTTLLGLLPMAVGLGEGSEMQVPLARAVIGGLTTSTLVTLLLVPCIYWLMEQRRARAALPTA